jgi:probable rRNA maturation factor
MEPDSCRPDDETLEDPLQPASPEAQGGGVQVDILVEDPAWRRFLPRAEALARRAVAAALAGSGAEGLVTVLLADDRMLRRLNGEHRGRDKPTNVLSFPAGAPGHLGDIALALGVVRREAEAGGKALPAHFAHLVAHGALHLIGHDHLAAGEARRMERAEARAMHRMRLPNPWRTAA